MVSAKLGQVRGITVRGSQEVPRLRSELRPSQSASSVFSFDPSTATSLSSSPLLRDPYEEQLLAVSQSSVPGAGRGVFARADIRDVKKEKYEMLCPSKVCRGQSVLKIKNIFHS